MGSKPRMFIAQWAINTLAVLVAAHVVSGIRYDRALDLVIASLLLGLLNLFVRPVLMMLSLPLLVLTLGLFTLVINAALLYAVGSLLTGFHVSSFAAAFWGALIVSLVSLALNLIVRPAPRVRVHRSVSFRRGPPRGEGPVIDV